MALLSSGKDFAKKYVQLNDLYIKDKDGNIIQEETDKIIDSIAILYNSLFQYMSEKITTATIKTPTAVTGTHITGPFTGTVTPSTINIKIR